MQTYIIILYFSFSSCFHWHFTSFHNLVTLLNLWPKKPPSSVNEHLPRFLAAQNLLNILIFDSNEERQMGNTHAHLPTLKTKATTWIERGKLLPPGKLAATLCSSVKGSHHMIHPIPLHVIYHIIYHIIIWYNHFQAGHSESRPDLTLISTISVIRSIVQMSDSQPFLTNEL